MHTGQGALRQTQRRQHRLQLRRHRTGGTGRLQRLRGLGTGHIVRVAAGQGKLRQLHGVGAVGGRLAGGDQLVGGGHLVPQDGGHLHEKIIGQGGDGGPLGNIGAVFQGRIRLRLAKAEVDPAVVHRTVEPALHRRRRRVVHIGGGGEDTVVPRRGGDGAGVHEDDASQLAVGGLGTLPVGEVAGGVADGQPIVGGYIPRAEAGAAEAGLEQCAGGQQGLLDTVFHQLQIDGDGGRIHRQGEIAAADVVAVQNGRGLGDVVVHTAGTPGDDALIHHQLAVHQLIRQVQPRLTTELGGGALLHLPQVVARVVEQLAERHRLGGVERQGGHRLHAVKVDGDHAIVVRAVLRVQGGERLFASVEGQIVCHGAIRLPDGGETGGLRGHHVDADAVVHGQAGHGGAGKFQHLILHEAVFVHRAAQGDGHIVGADAAGRLAGKPHQNDLRRGDVVGVFQQLLDDLRAALPHAHGAQRTVACVAVGA